MSASPTVDGDTVKLGLLMETMEIQQRTVDEALQRLQAHTRGLDVVVRDEIHRTLVDMLQEFANETSGAAETMKTIQRTMSIRSAIFALVLGAISAALPAGFAIWMLPAPGELAALREQRARLSHDVAELRGVGAEVEWHRCGDSHRLCFRVDRNAPAFGGHGDFLVPRGY